MGLRFVPFNFPGLETVGCAFQMRGQGRDIGEQGNMALYKVQDQTSTIANRKKIFELPGVEAFADLYQVHGTDLIFDPQAKAPELPSEIYADGLASSKTNLALMIKTADCQPLLLTNKKGEFIAALHVGWRGNRQSFPQKAVADLCARYAAAPEDLLVVRGPSLGPAWSEFVNYDEEWGSEYLPWYDADRKTVNLWRLTRDQFLEAGLRRENIFGLDLCTRTMHEHFFSYRLDHQCGVQASLIWKK